MRQWHRSDQESAYESHLLDQDEVAKRVSGVDPGSVPATGAVWPLARCLRLTVTPNHRPAGIPKIGRRLARDAQPPSNPIDRDGQSRRSVAISF
jgi:hypothetical protein